MELDEYAGIFHSKSCDILSLNLLEKGQLLLYINVKTKIPQYMQLNYILLYILFNKKHQFYQNFLVPAQ